MRKYHPGDKVTVRATVAYNCMSGRLLGVEIIGEGNIDHVTVVVPVDQIISHEKVPLRKGDKVRVNDPANFEKTFTVLEIYDDYAWVKTESSCPLTMRLQNLERV